MNNNPDEAYNALNRELAELKKRVVEIETHLSGVPGGKIKKNKYTSGPWTHYKNKLRSQFKSSPIIHEIHGPKGETIIKWGGLDGCDLPKSTIDANCNLIAAAPDLLEALERLVDAPLTLDYYRKNAAIRAAYAAIVKAKGEGE